MRDHTKATLKTMGEGFLIGAVRVAICGALYWLIPFVESDPHKQGWWQGIAVACFWFITDEPTKRFINRRWKEDDDGHRSESP